MGEGEKEKNLLKHFLFDGTPAFSTSPNPWGVGNPFLKFLMDFPDY